MNELYSCTFCKEVEYDSKWKLGGHLRHCKKRKEEIETNAFNEDLANTLANDISIEEYENQQSFNNLEEENGENNEILPNELTSRTFIQAYETATNEYLLRQKELLNVAELEKLQAGFTKTLDGLRGQADIRIYLEICEFASNNHGLSIKGLDNLLDLIRRITYINGYEIPLPQKYYTIHDKIFKAVNEKSIKIVKTHYLHCEDLFGKNNDLGKIPCVVTDIVDVIASMLVDPAIYPHLKLDYEENKLYRTETVGNKRQRTVDVMYGEFYNSEFFRKTEIEVRNNWGPCKIIPVFFGIDATNLNNTGSISATPVYMSVGNMSIDMLRSHIGIELVGYMPVTLASKAKMRSALEDNGVQYETNQDECVKMHSRWLEQECLHDFCTPMRR
jgi:hypothetical protein